MRIVGIASVRLNQNEPICSLKVILEKFCYNGGEYIEYALYDMTGIDSITETWHVMRSQYLQSML